MRTVDCDDCGHSIAMDDFVMGCCPICDSYMNLSRLHFKAEPELKSVVRVEHREQNGRELG